MLFRRKQRKVMGPYEIARTKNFQRDVVKFSVGTCGGIIITAAAGANLPTMITAGLTVGTAVLLIDEEKGLAALRKIGFTTGQAWSYIKSLKKKKETKKEKIATMAHRYANVG